MRAAGLDELLEFGEALLYTAEVDATLLGLLLAKLAKAGDAAGITAAAAMACAKSVRQGALALRSPHDAVNVVGASIILDQSGKKRAVVWIIEAEGARLAAMKIRFLNLLDARNVRTPDIFEPADSL